MTATSNRQPEFSPETGQSHRVPIRLIGLLLASAFGVGAWLAWSGGIGPVSSLRSAAASATALASLTVLCLSLAPASLVDPLLRHLNLLGRSAPFHAPRAGVFLLLTGWTSYLFLLGQYLSTPDDPAIGDQGAYLETAKWIAAHGGLEALPGHMLSGEYEEANRHPLYIALLSMRPGFPWGRGISAAFGIFTLAVLGVFLTRRHGLFSAGIATVLLGTNKLFLLSTSRMVCEGLLALLCLWLWWWTLPVPAQNVSPSSAARRGLKLGVLSGLVWLTKGTGLPMLGATTLWWLLGCGLNARQRVIGALLLVMGFLATGSLLIARNMQRFGEPFYNVNTLLLFADDFSELEPMLNERVTSREAATRYLAAHSPRQLVARAASGTMWEGFILLRSLGPAPLGDARVLFGLVLGLLAIGSLLLRPELRGSVLPWWLVALLPMFAWYVPIAAGDRFVVPLLPGLVVAAAVGLSTLPWCWQEIRWQRCTIGLITLALVSQSIASVTLTFLYGPNEFSPG